MFWGSNAVRKGKDEKKQRSGNTAWSDLSGPESGGRKGGREYLAFFKKPLRVQFKYI